ncbi:MAG: hypothetical protein IJS53_00895 [Clostridia bacterium]|nr:hypothetical protein [Clostridia bacterium]
MSKKKIRRKQAYKRKEKHPFKDWWKGLSPKKLKTIGLSCLAVLAVAALVAVCWFCIRDDGSLKLENGAAVGAQENWLVGERAKGKNSAFYHFADVATPAGYTKGTASLNGIETTVRTDFSFAKEDGENWSIYISPVYANAKDMAEDRQARIVQQLSGEGTVSAVEQYKSALGTTWYYTYSYVSTEPSDGAQAFLQAIVSYTPTAYRDAAILVRVGRTADAEDDLAGSDALLAELEKALAAVTLIK